MSFSENELKYIDLVVGEFCKSLTKPDIADQLNYSYEVDEHSVIVYENRLNWTGSGSQTQIEIAKFEYNKPKNVWLLYWMKGDLKWHRFEPAEETDSLEQLIEAVRKDEHCAFFG